MGKETLILDAQGLQHLDILWVSGGMKATRQGSLINWMDHTLTKFGGRELERWVTAPLTNISKINDRLDAVQNLVEENNLLQSTRGLLKKVIYIYIYIYIYSSRTWREYARSYTHILSDSKRLNVSISRT